MKFIILGVILSQSVLAADIKNQIVTEASKQGLEPQIALAVATVESGLNPMAVGKKGEIGLFQLNPKFLPAKFETKENIRLGIQHLLYWKKYCPVQGGYSWVTCYNQGARTPRYPELLPYYKKISKVLKSMEDEQ